MPVDGGKNTTAEIADGVDASADIELIKDGGDADWANTDSLHDIKAQTVAIATLLITRSVIKTVTFDGGAGLGGVGTVNLFSITGGVDLSLEAFCTATLVEAAATAVIEVGISGDTEYILPSTNATDINLNVIWHNASPGSSIALLSDASKEVTIKESDIFLTVGGQSVTAGEFDFSVIYTPRTSVAAVEAA